MIPKLATLLAALALVAPATAQALTAPQRDAALAQIDAELDKSYVFPERTAGIKAALAGAKAAGRYDVPDLTTFAGRVSDDLKAASGDGHLYLIADAAQYAAAKAPPHAAGDLDAFYRARARRENSGLVETKILPGNIRYLRITGFHWTQDESGAAYDDAMRFLKGGDAVIIDIRGNGGGSAEAANYLVSHFMDGETPLMTFVQAGERPVTTEALGYLPAGRLKGKPLYVLIDKGSASAAEDFAYNVQQFKLGELVGATTAGAANNNTLVPIDPGFMLSISVGRPEHAVSHGNWEGEGVAPTIVAEPSQALEAAQSQALARLAAAPGAAPAALAEYAWARAEVEARLHPVPVRAERLKRLAGDYGEGAKVVFENGGLWFTPRPDRPARRLSPLTAELFAVEFNERLRVRFTPQGLETVRLGEADPRLFPRR